MEGEHPWIMTAAATTVLNTFDLSKHMTNMKSLKNQVFKDMIKKQNSKTNSYS